MASANRQGSNERDPRSRGIETIELMGVNRINNLFPVAANLAVLVYALLLLVVYTITPKENWEYLPDNEQQAASVAFLVLMVSNVLILSRFAFQRKLKRHMSGIVYASLVTQVVAMVTNLILAFAPTIVLIDPVTRSRVFLVRWCEWIPLAGLMTFLSEGVSLSKASGGVKYPVLTSLSQCLSCLGGLIFPYCPGLISWSFWMFISFITYAMMFPRVWMKRKLYLDQSKTSGNTFIEKEHLDRQRFSYELILVCTVVWTALVVMFFLNMMAHILLPEDHQWRNASLAMLTDTAFDVLAKSIYMKLICDVHFAVFDAEGREQRQLGELRNLMSVLWDSSSDAIVISALHGQKITSLLSPSSLKLFGVDIPLKIKNRKSIALMIETNRRALSNLQDCYGAVSGSFVDCSDISYAGPWGNSILAELGDSLEIRLEASKLISAVWNHTENSGSETVMLYQCNQRKCEIKVSPHSMETLVAVVRDVTERFKRLEAERKAHSEAAARQKDAQSQTRFVRHEVKNGLLSGIELCDSLRNAIDDLERSLRTHEPAGCDSSDESMACSCSAKGRSSVASHTRRLTEELDLTLHEVLDTVLAEAMARDVIHEVYQPRSERLDVLSLFANSGSKTGNTERFPVIATTRDIPYLMLDPQLLRFIHRNAISNACKYGLPGSKVLTELAYDATKRTLQMQVKNEPGPGHDQLVALGHSACDVVFAQGSMLHKDLNHQSSYISSGDGAWIMQKCARTMRGQCSIEFLKDQTIFTLRCPAEPLSHAEWPETKDFIVPLDTWGVALDDSKVQRKLMTRIFGHVGVDYDRRVVLGESPSEAFELENLLLSILADHPNSKILVLVDENLDFGESDGEPVVLSGSLIMKDILTILKPEQESRVFALVRSANDSADDVALYVNRTHGFFPKAPMQRQRVRELMAPLWAERFLNSRILDHVTIDHTDVSRIERKSSDV